MPAIHMTIIVWEQDTLQREETFLGVCIIYVLCWYLSTRTFTSRYVRGINWHEVYELLLLVMHDNGCLAKNWVRVQPLEIIGDVNLISIVSYDGCVIGDMFYILRLL